ncbi:MAG: hypothetical protein NT011_03720 [Kiritimatiellaeota bacterium]|nr:hypothetical protein [Kiritimatiellota bacterium]
MKGLLISLALFVIYVLVTIILSHGLRVRQHAKLFFSAALAFSPIYFILFALTPSDCFILPATWLSDRPCLDITVGYLVFLLNCHSYIDFFYGFNCGFSISLLLEMLWTGDHGLDTDHFIRRFHRADGTDKIFGWRLPGLEASGYIRQDGQTGMYQLTRKGLAIARLTLFLKRLLNLGAGG